MGWKAGPEASELYADGTADGFVPGLPLSGVRLMGAGQDLEFHEPPRVGADVTLETTVTDVELKKGDQATCCSFTSGAGIRAPPARC